MPKKKASKKKKSSAVKKQRGGMTPANPNVNVPRGVPYPSRGLHPYGRPGSPGGAGLQATRTPQGISQYQPYGGSGAGRRTGQAELNAQYGIDSARMADLNRRMGAGATRRPTGPPRRPPPPIRPGYNVGGPVPETNASLAGKGYQGGGAFMPPSRPRIQDFMGGVAGGPPGRRPTLGPQPRRRRGRGRGGRDV